MLVGIGRIDPLPQRALFQIARDNDEAVLTLRIGSFGRMGAGFGRLRAVSPARRARNIDEEDKANKMPVV